jgi:hypothetical protein
MSSTSQTSVPKNGGSEKKEETVKQQPVVEKKSYTLEEIEQRNTFLNSLFAKRQRLNEAKIKLEKFHLGVDDFSVSVRFGDNAGNSFNTSHRETIERMVRMVADGITSSLIEVDTHIKSIFE